MGKSLVSCFFRHSVLIRTANFLQNFIVSENSLCMLRKVSFG